MFKLFKGGPFFNQPGQKSNPVPTERGRCWVDLLPRLIVSLICFFVAVEGPSGAVAHALGEDTNTFGERFRRRMSANPPGKTPPWAISERGKLANVFGGTGERRLSEDLVRGRPPRN